MRKYLPEVKLAERRTALQQKNKSARKKLPVFTEYRPVLSSLKKILVGIEIAPYKKTTNR